MESKATHSMLAPLLSEGDPLNSLMWSSSGLKKNASEKTSINSADLYWNHSHYGLAASTVYDDLSTEKKRETLQRLNHWSLSLAYFIEKFGLNYGAQMVFLSESTQEKSLYALFGADEVKHRLAIEPFMLSSPPQNLDFHPLLNALGVCLEQGEKDTMVLTIQVILEGFGLTHYKSLRDSCQSPELQHIFTNILLDEHHHHGMGVALAQKMRLTNSVKEQMSELTAMFVRALIDAEWVMKSVETAHGGLSDLHRKKFLTETRWTEQIQGRIERLKALLRKAGCAELVETLDQKGVFSPKIA